MLLSLCARMAMEAIPELVPSLAAQIDYLVTRSAPLQLRVENIRKGSPNARYADRFSVLVPCCLDHVKWDIIFNCEYPGRAPDIVFSEDDEKFHPIMLTDDNQGSSQGPWNILRDWSVKDPSRLLRLVMELRSLYLQYQRRLVEEVDDPRLRFEIGTISSMQGLEMCLVKIAEKLHEVKFAVPLLQMDLSQLVRRKHQAVIYLQVVFPMRKGQASSPMVPQLKLFAPPELKEVFDVEDVKLPIWPDGMCLAEYTPTLKDTLKRQVNDAFSSVTSRRSFIESLSVPFGRPIEAETIFGRRVSVLASSGIFVFLVHFSLSTQFPKHQPSLTFQSCQHFDSMGKPVTKLYKDYPWSPRWDISEMVHRIYDFVVDECTIFKKFCNDSLQHHR